jgi:hypothetical protein
MEYDHTFPYFNGEQLSDENRAGPGRADKINETDDKLRIHYETSEHPSSYDNWCAVAGDFGDGGLDVEAQTHTLHWVLNFTDNWPPQLSQVKFFLEGQQVSVGKVRRTGVGGFKIEVAAIESLKRCAGAMLETRCLFKKREELKSFLNILAETLPETRLLIS